MKQKFLAIDGTGIAVREIQTLIVGSGAAGLNSAVQLHSRGIEDLLIVTEGLDMSSSINIGSDKYTYYKSAMCGDDADAPLAMAANYFEPGGMHDDLALVEAAVSGRAFLNLVSLLTVGEDDALQVCGALAVNENGGLAAFSAEKVIFAVGGPGGLYKRSVYPAVHTGGIGIALKAGARAQGLPESQYGLASVKFRWNVSGSYMQVVPRFVSTAADGSGEEREFLREYFDDIGEMFSKVFLKGYQWPFDSRKIPEGSSIIDILVFIETVKKGRRVFPDFRDDPEGFSLEKLDTEAREYLEKSGARQGSPIERLSHINLGAIELYRDHNIDIDKEMLEVAVSAQHNNGGLAGNLWWESVNIRGLYPVGEVNGSHGVARPGESALNAGQVGGFRAAEHIAGAPSMPPARSVEFEKAAIAEARDVLEYLDRCRKSELSWKSSRAEIQDRMTRSTSHIRSVEELKAAVKNAGKQLTDLEESGCSASTPPRICSCPE